MNSEGCSVAASDDELVGTESATLEKVEPLTGEDGMTPGGGGREREIFWVDWETGAEGFRE
jgi:hypothetical protein